MKIGIIKEGKIPPERRVSLLPMQCKEIMHAFPEIEFIVEPSEHRCISDEEYKNAGITLSENMDQCDILLGIKEVPIYKLIENKTYFFFSHTIKAQEHNKKLLKTILEKNITLIDYECLTNPVTHERLIAFGRYAGIVGAYNAIWMYGKKFNLFDIKRSYHCYNYAEIQQEYSKVNLPPIKIAITGTGRVGKGAMEVLDGMNIRKVSSTAFLEKKFDEPVYTPLQSRDYHYHINDSPWDNEDFHNQPQNYETVFSKFTKVADVLIATSYWDPKAPKLFSDQDMLSPDFKMKIIADITCDINGSIPSTIKPTSILEPVFDFDPEKKTEEEAFSNIKKNISVMSIDNLPCEIPYDASEFFGRQFIEFILPHFFNHDERKILKNATITANGKLTEKFSYLKDFVG